MDETIALRSTEGALLFTWNPQEPGARSFGPLAQAFFIADMYVEYHRSNPYSWLGEDDVESSLSRGMACMV